MPRLLSFQLALLVLSIGCQDPTGPHGCFNMTALDGSWRAGGDLLGRATATLFASGTLQLEAKNRFNPAKKSEVIIVLPGARLPGTYTLGPPYLGNYAMYMEITPSDDLFCCLKVYRTTSESGGYVEIATLDIERRRLSGTFSFYAYGGHLQRDTIAVTGGAFQGCLNTP